MWLVSLISYIDRNTLALLSPAILAETGLSAEQYGYIISAFSVAYMIGNPVWGVMLDRFGLRAGMFWPCRFGRWPRLLMRSQAGSGVSLPPGRCWALERERHSPADCVLLRRLCQKVCNPEASLLPIAGDLWARSLRLCS